MNRRQALQQTALLMGGVVSAGVVSAVLSGCKPTYDINWTPQLLTKDEAILTGELAETILPETDTPGAKSLHVDEFIDLVLKDCFPEADQQSFKAGLASLNDMCQTQNGSSFLDSSPEKRTQFLKDFEDKQRVEAAQNGGKAFFTQFKELALAGYFTSEAVITEQLHYNPLPQQYKGCVEAADPIIEVGIQGRSA